MTTRESSRIETLLINVIPANKAGVLSQRDPQHRNVERKALHTG